MRKIPLSQGQVALVDDDDFERLSQHSWWLTNGYASGRIDGEFTYMHREVLDAGPDDMVDHTNHNKLDNRKENLRLVNDRQNIANSRPYGRSRFKGVYAVSGHKGIYKDGGKPWRAQINQNGKTIYLGTFKTEEEAARAYNEAARDYFGDHAWLNPVS